MSTKKEEVSYEVVVFQRPWNMDGWTSVKMWTWCVGKPKYQSIPGAQLVRWTYEMALLRSKPYGSKAVCCKLARGFAKQAGFMYFDKVQGV